MDVVGDLVARDRDVAGVVLRTAGGEPARSYEYHRFATTAMKAGNFLRLHGVRTGSTLAIATGAAPEPVFGFLGAALLGATVRFDPGEAVDAAAYLAPTHSIEAPSLPAGTTRIAYGDAPSDPAVEHFERGLWSENPTFPPRTIEPTASMLETGTGTMSHATLLRAASTVADTYGIDDGTAIAVRASIAAPWALVAGVLAPLLAGGTVVLVTGADAATDAALAVTDGSAPEATAIEAEDVVIPNG